MAQGEGVNPGQQHEYKDPALCTLRRFLRLSLETWAPEVWGLSLQVLAVGSEWRAGAWDANRGCPRSLAPQTNSFLQFSLPSSCYITQFLSPQWLPSLGFP